MKTIFSAALCAAGLMLAASSFAQAPAGAPAGTTGVCKDGSFSSADVKKGACRGHKGVQDWYGTTAAAGAAGAAAAAAPAPTSKAAPAPAPMAAPAPAPAAMAPSAMAPAAKGMGAGAKGVAATPAPGGGPGMVWANLNSKVYHCQGTKYYGTTKNGEYLSEADAKTKGFHADHGKACS